VKRIIGTSVVSANEFDAEESFSFVDEYTASIAVTAWIKFTEPISTSETTRFIPLLLKDDTQK
jgi:hypothetical protein